ncbi:hypothetical protein [Paracerasibacillus soli]|uniref:Uncharacterized protein n=1 Tax=Paracerasibacillus soli TaxID=480284 RepID=A0ABU5CU30_9BACI|nr:hypothetical protein [Virgibacillus soli]MDY0409376.1 hypothetical protein [Virgibacillus soli]
MVEVGGARGRRLAFHGRIRGICGRDSFSMVEDCGARGRRLVLYSRRLRCAW